MHCTQVAGVKDSHVAVVSRNGVAIVAVLQSQSQSQLQCCSHNCNVTVEDKVARSQGMRKRRNGVLHKLHCHTGK